MGDGTIGDDEFAVAHAEASGEQAFDPDSARRRQECPFFAPSDRAGGRNAAADQRFVGRCLPVVGLEDEARVIVEAASKRAENFIDEDRARAAAKLRRW